MSLCSLAFVFFCMAIVAVFQFVGGKRLRQFVLAAANAAFLLTFVPDVRSGIYFAVVLAGTYLALVFVRLSRRGAVVAGAIVLSVLVFFWFKRFSFFGAWVPYEWGLAKSPPELVGLSYLLFKLVHMLVDEWQGQLAPFNLWSYLNYQLAFFTLTAGPLQRYNDFQRSWQDLDTASTEPRDAMLFWCRILLGLLKIRVLGAWAESAYSHAVTPSHHPELTDFLVGFYGYPLYLYLNFSGYTDVMIAAGGLLGFRVPENFNYPFLARNVLDFWDRWHISLTHWIRDYFFMSSYKAAATRFPRAARYWGYYLLFMALFLAGVWHGTTEGFVAFGILNGLGAAAVRIYGDGLRAALGPKGLHAYLQNRLIRWIAVLVTLNYVCLSMLFFSSDFGPGLTLLTMAWTQFLSLPALLAAHSWGTRDAALVAATVFLLVAIWKSDAIGRKLARLATASSRRAALLGTVMGATTVIVVTLFFFDWALQEIPPPVRYMAF